MPIKSKPVKLSVLPSRISKILEVGRANKMQNVDGSLKLTTICMKIIVFVLDLHADAKIQAYLKENNGTLLDLIRRAVHRYISEEGR